MKSKIDAASSAVPIRSRVIAHVSVNDQAADGSHPVVMELTAEYLQTEKHWAPLADADVSLRFYRQELGGRPEMHPPVEVYLDKGLTMPAPPNQIPSNGEGRAAVYITCSTDEYETFYVVGDVTGIRDKPGDTEITHAPGDPDRHEIRFYKPGHPINTGVSR
jgi:hypothetical protein